MAWSIKAFTFPVPSLPVNHSFSSSSSSSPLLSLLSSSSSSSLTRLCSTSARSRRRYATPFSYFLGSSKPRSRQRCRAGEYVFPDPIPEFAEAETEKFKNYLLEKLSKMDIYEDSCEEVVNICTEIISTFLQTEYGGPGTLLVIPFIDMADTINERGLPGGPEAARAAVVWAQEHVDKDWNKWTGGENA